MCCVTLHVDSHVAPVAADDPEFNPYLHGLYAPTYDELTIPDLEVLAGEIPADLDGVYVRNGPNPRQPPSGRYHWFDGDGMVHAVHFADGRAGYRNRWIRTDGYEAETAAGKALWQGIMETGSARQGHGQHRPDLPSRPSARDLVSLRQALRAGPGDAGDDRRR